MKRITLFFIASLLTLNNTHPYKIYIEHLYGGKSGFVIPKEEEEFIKNTGNDSTYGEITYEGVEKLIKKFNLKKEDCFYDLGCGIGKMVIQIYLTTPAKKSCGIELSSSRTNKAKQIKRHLKQESKIDQERQLKFIEGDILNASLEDASAIFISSLCFSDDLMEKITNKLSRLKNGLKIATSQKLPNKETFKLIETINIPMTWSPSSPIYLYELTNPHT